ncbi:MAG: ABC-F family ATP-binding cassette domain-containing protein [Patescibacteria group bacterium]
MPLLAATTLEKSFGADLVIRGASLEIEPRQRLALVGRNGCGKTTLLRLLAGSLEPDRGSIHLARGALVGLLEQEFSCDDERRTLRAEMEAVFADLAALEAEAERVAGVVARADANHDALMARYAWLQEELERRGAYTVPSRIDKVLRGVGFDESDYEKPLAVLSGGERTRAGLARLLLRQPDLLLLDEPTNHLDLWATAWLEEYLSSYADSVLVVSHDRYFLDRVVQDVYELAEGTLRYHRGNYTAYRTAKVEELRVLEHTARVREREAARLHRLVRESAADERSKRQARSIAKRLERMEPTPRPAGDERAMSLRLVRGEAMARIVLEVEDLHKAFDTGPLLKGAGFRLEAGEKVGVIGPNGSGKTTLLRLILGLERPGAGRVRYGTGVRTGYLAQDEFAAGGQTVFAALQDAGGGDNQDVRSHLARFLFRGEDVWKNVGDLSGGERRRLALARLTLGGADLLLLDEPTNHLDLPSIEALEDGLKNYAGAVLVVSHDRYFLGRVAGRLLALHDGILHPFPSYEAYAAWHAAREARAAEARADEAAARRQRQRLERLARQSPQREIRRRARQAEELEAALAAKEEERAAILQELAKPEVAADFAALRDLTSRLAALEDEITALYKDWEAVMSNT